MLGQPLRHLRLTRNEQLMVCRLPCNVACRLDCQRMVPRQLANGGKARMAGRLWLLLLGPYMVTSIGKKSAMGLCGISGYLLVVSSSSVTQGSCQTNGALMCFSCVYTCTWLDLDAIFQSCGELDLAKPRCIIWIDLSPDKR